MRLINLEIHNFRGIQNAKIDFPMNNRFICLIGAPLSGSFHKHGICQSVTMIFILQILKTRSRSVEHLLSFLIIS